jgi:hypothetical protein
MTILTKKTRLYAAEEIKKIKGVDYAKTLLKISMICHI